MFHNIKNFYTNHKKTIVHFIGLRAVVRNAQVKKTQLRPEISGWSYYNGGWKGNLQS